MKRFAFAFLAFASVLYMAPMAGAASQTVPRGAYVRKPVSSVDELVLHINADPTVRNRFANHFGVAPDKLDEYLQDNVVITKVNKSTPREVYIVTRNGRFVAQKKVLKTGTPIFALKDTGEPLLVQSCGNPVLKQLPPRVKVKAEGPQVYQVMRPNELPLPMPVAEIPPVVASPPPPSVAPPVPPVVIPPAAIPPVVVARSGPGLLPLLPLIPLIGAGGGGGGQPPPPPPPPPIPEPAGAAAVMATALLPAAGWGIRMLRKRGSAS